MISRHPQLHGKDAANEVDEEVVYLILVPRSTGIATITSPPVD
jgi:hypothetical protein